MNSVGGIQVFAALKACGSVLKTVPDFDALYEDEFYPVVYYYLASASSAADIEDVAFLSDVTLSTDAQIVEPESAAKDNEAAAAPAPAQTVSVQTEPEALLISCSQGVKNNCLTVTNWNNSVSLKVFSD